MQRALPGEDGLERAVELQAALAQVFGGGVRMLHIEQALLDAVLAGWQNQMSSRNLAPKTKSGRLSLVRRVVSDIGIWPWEWRGGHGGGGGGGFVERESKTLHPTPLR